MWSTVQNFEMLGSRLGDADENELAVKNLKLFIKHTLKHAKSSKMR